MKIKLPEVGDKFGEWNVVEVGSRKCLCCCSCNTIKLVSVYTLLDGKSTRCFKCARKESRVGRRIVSTVGYKLSAKLRGAVKNAIERCTDENYHQYKDYGGRGIKVYQPWVDNPHLFVQYLTTLEGYNNVELFLDRINNDGNYEPGNLRFTTKFDSAKNRRVKVTTKLITYNGKTQRPFDWAKEIGISLTTFMDRLGRGWTVEKIITTPARRYQR